MIPPVVEPGDVLQRLRMPNAAGVVGKAIRVVSVSGDTAQLEWADAAYTSGSYADPAWITALAASKITGTFMKLQQHAQTAYYDAAGTFTQPLTIKLGLRLEQIVAPTTRATATVGSAGNLTGTFRYYVSFVSADGETEPGIESFSVSPSSQRVDVTEIPLGPSGVTARKLWRATVVGQEQFNLKLVTTIADNTTTTYTDNTASLSTVCSRRNSTGGYWSINGDPVAIIGSSLVSFGYGNGTDPIGIQNVQFGIECGKEMTLGYWNCLFGYLAGRDITTGYENSYFGFIAGRDTTTGWYNCAFGGQTLSANTSGKNNVAMGFSALASNTTGIDNTALGTFACNEHVDSEGVVAVGINAARFLANGTTAMTSSRLGVYIGYDAKGSADDLENEIVIGYNAIGNGSNTVTLGNTSIVNTYLRGTVNVAAFIASGTATFNDPATFNDTSTFNDTIKISKGDTNADTYPTRISSIAFSRGDLPSSYLNRITNSFSSVASQSSMNFEVGDGSGSGYVVPLSLRGNGSSFFTGTVEFTGAMTANAATFNGLVAAPNNTLIGNSDGTSILGGLTYFRPAAGGSSGALITGTGQAWVSTLSVGGGLETTPPTNGLLVQGAATFNGNVSSSTEYRLGGNSFSRVAQMDGAGGWGGGYNFNVNSSTSQRDSTGAVAAIRFDQSSVQLFAESSGSPGAISPRYTFGPTQATFAKTLAVNDSGLGTVYFGPDSFVSGTDAFLAIRQAGSGSLYQDFGTSVIFRRTTDFATMATLTNGGDLTTRGSVNARYGVSISEAATGDLSWVLYRNDGGPTQPLYLLDAANSRSQMYFTSASTDANASTHILSKLFVTQVAEFGKGLNATGAYPHGSSGVPGVISYEYPYTRHIAGDGSGYAWAVSKRTGGVTTDLFTIYDASGDATFNGAATFGGIVSSNAFRHRNSAGEFPWMLYSPGTDVSWYIRDMVNSRMQMTFTPGASASAAVTQINSVLNVESIVTSAFQTLSGDPTTLDIPSGMHRVVKNTTSGEVRDWVNDNGTMRKSAAYT